MKSVDTVYTNGWQPSSHSIPVILRFPYEAPPWLRSILAISRRNLLPIQ